MHISTTSTQHHLGGPGTTLEDVQQRNDLSRKPLRFRWIIMVLLLLGGSFASATQSLAQTHPPSEEALRSQELRTSLKAEAHSQKNETASEESLAAVAPFLEALSYEHEEGNSQVDLLVDALGPELAAQHYDFDALEREDRIRRLQQILTCCMLLLILFFAYKRKRSKKA